MLGARNWIKSTSSVSHQFYCGSSHICCCYWSVELVYSCCLPRLPSMTLRSYCRPSSITRSRDSSALFRKCSSSSQWPSNSWFRYSCTGARGRRQNRISWGKCSMWRIRNNQWATMFQGWMTCRLLITRNTNWTPMRTSSDYQIIWFYSFYSTKDILKFKLNTWARSKLIIHSKVPIMRNISPSINISNAKMQSYSRKGARFNTTANIMTDPYHSRLLLTKTSSLLMTTMMMNKIMSVSHAFKSAIVLITISRLKIVEKVFGSKLVRRVNWSATMLCRWLKKSKEKL